VGMKILW